MKTYMICVLLAVGSVGAREPQSRVQAEPRGQVALETRSPRDTVAEFLRRIKWASAWEAFDLTTRSAGTSWSKAFPQLADFDQIRPLHLLAAEDYALVISNAYQGQNRIENFCAFLVKQKDSWLVNRIMRVRPSEAAWMIRGCLANPAVKADITPAELVGTWSDSCFLTVTLAADGTGTELWDEPGTDKSDARCKPITWKVQGSTLILQFGDHCSQLDIDWVHGDTLRYSYDGGYSTWFRCSLGMSSLGKP